MQDSITFYMVCALGAASIPTIHSIIKETRFTEKSHLIYGGIAAIFYAFVYVLDPNFPVELSYLKVQAFPVILGFGIISLLAGLKVENNHEGLWTLFLSKRQFGAIGIAFLWPTISNGVIPKLIDLPQMPEMFDFAISLLIIVNAITYSLWVIRRILPKTPEHFRLHV